MNTLLRIGIWLIGIGTAAAIAALMLGEGLGAVAIVLPAIAVLVAGIGFLIAAAVDQRTRKPGGPHPLASWRFVIGVLLAGVVAAGVIALMRFAGGAGFLLSAPLAGFVIFAVAFLLIAGFAALVRLLTGRRLDSDERGPLFGPFYESPKAIGGALLIAAGSLAAILLLAEFGRANIISSAGLILAMSAAVTFLGIAAKRTATPAVQR